MYSALFLTAYQVHWPSSTSTWGSEYEYSKNGTRVRVLYSSTPSLYPSMDWWFCPLLFWSRKCWSVCHMLQMPHIQFPVLFYWSNCLQLHSWNLCHQAKSQLVYWPLHRGGVLEGVLGLEDRFWSPWPWPRRSSPWPWPQVLKNWPVLGSRIALVF